MTARPDLYVFAISHYCEKARWALDFLGVDYQLRHLAPGPHVEATRRLGASETGLPLLVHAGGIVQGSSAIIDWAEAAHATPSRHLSVDAALADECRALEQRLDDIGGFHARRFYYSEALVEHPDSVRPIFEEGLADDEREALRRSWPVVSQVMASALDLGAAQGRESRGIVEAELDWLDGLLADGRRYLVGDRFSRADLTAASLLAPLVLPPEHPTYSKLAVPPRVRADFALWSERKVAAWVRDLYRRHR